MFIISFNSWWTWIFFLFERSLFSETAENAIVLNYNVINDVTMMQCINQQIKYFIPAKVSIHYDYSVQWIEYAYW